VDAWHPREGSDDRRLRFSPLGADDSRHVLIPCGKCAGCLRRRANDWAVRCFHEAQFPHDGVACFITRTYDNDHLPRDFSLSKTSHQHFMKRLWRALGRHVPNLSCGEYGDDLKRPHYHDIIFGEDFLEDREPYRRSPTGGLLYKSPRLSKAWPFGDALSAEFHFDTAFYVAKYNVKQLEGDARKRDALRRWDSLTGEEWFVAPPFLLMSRAPAIGKRWFDRFSSDVFPSDFVVIDGRKLPVPAYYMRLLEKRDDSVAEAVRAARRAAAFTAAADRTERRLITRHEVGALRASRFAREVA
jgi:hypothetical protein